MEGVEEKETKKELVEAIVVSISKVKTTRHSSRLDGNAGGFSDPLESDEESNWILAPPSFFYYI